MHAGAADGPERRRARCQAFQATAYDEFNRRIAADAKSVEMEERVEEAWHALCEEHCLFRCRPAASPSHAALTPIACSEVSSWAGRRAHAKVYLAIDTVEGARVTQSICVPHSRAAAQTRSAVAVG